MNLQIDSGNEFHFLPEDSVSEEFVILEPIADTQNQNVVHPVLFVPEDFDPSKYLATDRETCGDRARYLLHTIHTQSIFNHRDREQGVRLKAEYLRNFMTKHHYVGIIKDLEAGGVIEVERTARDGQCNLYRLADDYRIKYFRRYYPKDGYLVRKLKTWRAEQDRQLTCSTRRHLKYQLSRVRINIEAARNCLLNLSLTDIGHSDCFNCLLRLHDEDWYFVPDRYGRVHHNVSCLKRELRQFLRVDGESLVELDIGPVTNGELIQIAEVDIATFHDWMYKGRELPEYSMEKIRKHFSA
ncbi:hypothetical protein [Gimesia sp.]|uniref:hypothetical protein n=1 Tax=Gimesia sp. TaxID=2024833 RepID=UPI003A90C890